MSKLTYESGYLFLYVEGRDKINKELIERASKNAFDGVLAFEFNENKKMIRYKLSDLVSLRVRGGSSIDKREMIFLFKNIFESVTTVMKRGILPNFIDWSPDLIFLDGEGNVFWLIYPLEVKSVEGGGLFNLVELLIRNLKPFEKTDEVFLESVRKNLEKVYNAEISREDFLFEFRSTVNKFYKKLGEDYKPLNLQRMVYGKEPEIVEDEEVEDFTTTLGEMDYDLGDVLLDIQENTTFIPSNLEEDDHTQIIQEDIIENKNFVGILTRPNGDKFNIESEEVYFGKVSRKGAPVVDIELEGNPAISRKHFKITRTSEEFYLEDLGSTNGTWVDGRRLIANEPIELVNNSKIRVADEEMTFLIREV